MPNAEPPAQRADRRAQPPPARARSLAEAFRLAVAEHPDRVAVTADDGELTYRDLAARAERVAAALRAAGVGADTPVPLIADPGLDLVVGLVAATLSGGAYVPVDPAVPELRIRWLVADCAAPVVLATTRTAGFAPDVPAVLIDDPDEVATPTPPAPVAGTDLAYVMHTSGPTGAPEGVLVEHRSVLHLFTATDHRFGFGADDVWPLLHSVGFDLSVWELWGALLHGGRLVVVPRAVTRDARRLHALVTAESVTVLNQTPTAFRHFQAAGPTPPSLRAVVLAGEHVDVETLRPWFARHGDTGPQLVTTYGSTETTVHASCHRLTTADLDAPSVSPIGRPLPGVTFHLAGEELFVSGPGVARGYLNRAARTARRFVVRDGERTFRTGDRVRPLPDGGFAWLGRADDQLNVRGHRVEPAEVEAVVNQHPEVEACLVTTTATTGDPELVAYVVPPPGVTGDPVWWERLRLEVAGRVAEALPHHLRPHRYLPVAELPRTRDGEVDRANPGRTTTQHLLTQLWREALNTQTTPTLTDDFATLGGTSESLRHLLSRVEHHFGITLPPDTTTADPDEVTIATLAAEVDAHTLAAPHSQDRAHNHAD
ncbi:non-ribosomal peptide synthetase [Actinokineospora spheciospongiae]|uniref:Non-ribosomal peptide synthetase n=1 Tax=Actinokineospora spheciospongiae TaxID=909613 RepID=W7IXU1_9PSEU|nr:non-ribosomal peptide synthetase [Actinokineospora spheciospongiae]EWC61301.1 non-ribosomal peptide synthetase [Actinokineospora spheciospongiae]